MQSFDRHDSSACNNNPICLASHTQPRILLQCDKTCRTGVIECVTIYKAVNASCCSGYSCVTRVGLYTVEGKRQLPQRGTQMILYSEHRTKTHVFGQRCRAASRKCMHRRRSGWTSRGTHGQCQRWVGAKWSGVWGGVSPPQQTRGPGRASWTQLSGVRGENRFWRILKATERSFFYLHDKIWGGQFALVVVVVNKEQYIPCNE